MLSNLNNPWVILISCILVFAIVKKIINLNKPFDRQKFSKQIKNQKRLKKKLTLETFKQSIPNLASYYVGLY